MMTADETNARSERIDRWLWFTRFFKSRSLAATGGRDEVFAEHYRPVRYIDRLTKKYPGFDATPYDRRIRSVRGVGYILVGNSNSFAD